MRAPWVLARHWSGLAEEYSRRLETRALEAEHGLVASIIPVRVELF